MKITIYHNPKCGTSRNVLALIRERGHEPQIMEYLKDPPSPGRIRELLTMMDLEPRDMMRRKQPEYTEIGLDNPAVPDNTLIEAMASHPILIERPIVVSDKGARICRPKERVLEIL